MLNDTSPSTSGVRIERRNALGIITLDRPKALNAFDSEMRRAIAGVLPEFAKDPIIYGLAFRSNSDKAFCAGGDVRKIIAAYRDDPSQARAMFADEYALDWALECFSKPSVSLIDGAVMGSGVGLSAFNTHRVAGENYRFAMPETAIGLFPDVGAAHVLARLPHEMGLYLGLTGRTIGRADAYALGLVTHCVSSELHDDIIEQLGEAWPIDKLLDDRHVDPGESDLMRHALTISNCFAAATPTAILDRLATVTGSETEWANGVRDDLLERAPMSLEVTVRHIRQARTEELRDTLVRDYRLACRFLEGRDFAEGVRALLIDKDKSPKWHPAVLADVDPVRLDAYFRTLSDELVLPAREQMQAIS